MSVAPKDNMRADLDAMQEHLRGGAEVGSVPDDAPAPERGLLEDAPTLADTPEPVEETAAQKAERARDEGGRFAKEKAEKAKVAPEVNKKPALVKPVPGAPVPEVKPAPAAPAAVALKAPSSWRPEVREKWAILPPEAQAEIVRRERQVDAALQENKALKERVGGYDSVVQPFMPMLRATGADPRAAMGQMLQAQHTLVYGGPAQKAGLLANIIKGYGVPLEALAQAIDGIAVQPSAGTVDQQQFRDPRFDQFLSTLEARKAELAQQTRAAAASQWEKFTAENEFAEDLREEIADLMEVGNRGSRQRTLEQSYDMALHAHPEYRKVLDQRQAAADATAQAAATQAKKAAAVSLKTVPGGGSVDGSADSDGTVGGDLRKMLRSSR